MGAIWNQPVLNFFPIMLIGFAQSLTSDAAVGCRQIKSLSPECGIWRCDALLKVVNFGPPKKIISLCENIWRKSQWWDPKLLQFVQPHLYQCIFYSRPKITLTARTIYPFGLISPTPMKRVDFLELSIKIAFKEICFSSNTTALDTTPKDCQPDDHDDATWLSSWRELMVSQRPEVWGQVSALVACVDDPRIMSDKSIRQNTTSQTWQNTHKKLDKIQILKSGNYSRAIDFHEQWITFCWKIILGEK